MYRRLNQLVALLASNQVKLVVEMQATQPSLSNSAAVLQTSNLSFSNPAAAGVLQPTKEAEGDLFVLL